ncbi:MAG: LacI family DNA-binding transcriptional regulator [Christensenellales bacterium]
MKKVTMEEIADSLNVSKGLVSKALTGKYGVSDEMRTTIKMKAVELGYNLDKINRKTVKKRCVLFISSRVVSRERFWQPIIVHMENRLSLDGVALEYFVYDDRGLSDGDKDRLANTEADVFLIMHNNTKFLMDALKKKAVPIIVIDPRYEYLCKYLQIRPSNYESAFEITKYLVTNGHDEILYYGAKDFSVSFQERFRGVSDCIKEEGKHLSVLEFDNSTYRFEDKEALKSALRENPGITAIICANDLIAVSVYKVAEEMGLSIPDDLSVVGFDNSSESLILRPQLTTIDIPRKRIGEETANIILRIIEDKRLVMTAIEINCEILKRDSVRELKEDD